MPMTAESQIINYDSLLTLTTKYYSKEYSENFLKHRPAVNIFFDGYSQTNAKGGRFWQDYADYGFNSTVSFKGPLDTYAQEVAQTSQPLMWEWKYMGGSVGISQIEMLENSGVVEIGNLLKKRMDQLSRTFNLIIGNEIFSDGTNYNGKTFTGLAAAISTTPTVGTVGGLNAATWPWWRNNATTACGSFAANGVNGSTEDKVLRAWDTCTDGSEAPTHIISDQTTFESYNRTNLQPFRYVNLSQQTADMTFRALEYQGRPWTLTPQAERLAA